MSFIYPRVLLDYFRPPAVAAKISKETETFCESNQDIELLEVVLVTNIPFDNIPRNELESYGVKLLSDMSSKNVHALCVRGRGKQLQAIAEKVAWIVEVQLIPGLITCGKQQRTGI